MDHIIDVVTDRGIPFRVVYGVRNNIFGKPITEHGPVVAFYDRRYPHTEHGQFVSDYFADDILGSVAGINLSGDVPAWTIDRANMVTIGDWLEMVIENLV